MTFKEFMQKVDKTLVAKCGLDSQCLADAPWRDLYEELGEEVTQEDIFECAAEWDDTFRRFLELI